MRPIKFRAWRKEIESMIESNQSIANIISRKIAGGTVGGTAVAYSDIKDNNASEYELMQFTGLLDKNGKEIYEKCIIDNEYEVNFIPPGYIIKNIYTGDILNFNDYEGQLSITKEYSEL